MDSAVRHLRDGALPDATSCPTCCVLDNLSVIGGAMVLQHTVSLFINAMRQGRSQASSVRLVDLTGSMAETAAAAAATAGGPASRQGPALPLQTLARPAADLEVIDLFSDPWGWRQPALAGGRGVPETSAGSSEPPQPSGTGSSAADSAPAAPLGAHPGPLLSLDALRSALLRPPPSAQTPDCSSGPPAASTSSAPTSQRPSEGPVDAPGAVPASASAPPPAASTSRGGGGRSVCVVIGCLSTLMERYGEWQALAMLEAVQRSPLVSCVLTALHSDLHSEQVLCGVRRLASCVLELSALPPLQHEMAQRAVAGSGRDSGGGALAGRLDCRTKRKTGRVKVESELYSVALLHPTQPSASTSTATALTSLATGGPLQFFPLPPLLDVPDPKSLLRLQPASAAAAAATGAASTARAAPAAGGAAAAGPSGPAKGAAASAPGTGGGLAGQPVGLLSSVATAEELARAVGGSMRLTLTEEERRAKQQVVLPYQHTGQARGRTADAYAAGDHAAYLPPAAGGRGPAAGGPNAQSALGHIMYVRDSASEADSDQELDEDLDI